MTEAEWLTARRFDDAMYAAALGSPNWSFRKETLFSVACCQRVLPILAEGRASRLLSEFEAAALPSSGTTPAGYSNSLSRYVIEAIEGLGERSAKLQVVYALGSAGNGYISEVAEHCALAVTFAGNGTDQQLEGADPNELRIQAHIIRDIVGNPFRPATFDPTWRTSTVLTLAQSIYDSRDFTPMPILADALQDAGCDNDDILAHCRDGHATHVRGCWVVDRVLGKE